MEFFERAHVVKNKNSIRKGTKSEEIIKKELKQMLYGYNNSDKNLIKSLEKPPVNFEDSSSVSGYSDLNLTQSSLEDDVQEDKAVSDPKSSNSSAASELTLDKSSNIIINNTQDNTDEEVRISESLSSGSILFEDKSIELAPTASSSGSDYHGLDDNFVMTSTDIESSSCDDESDFDADGELAARILEKLNKNEKAEKNIKSKKRKLDEESSIDADDEYTGPYRPHETDSDEDDDVKMENLSLDLSNISLPANEKFKGPLRPMQSSSDEEIDVNDDEDEEDNVENEEKDTEDEEEDDLSENEPSTHSSPLSPAFESVQAKDMKTESLDDILGEYRHPTMRNLPSDTQHVPSHSDLFEAENMSLVDMQQDDEVDSLVPEIDNKEIEQIIQDITELDRTIEPNDESTSLDDVIQTEDSSLRESSTDSIDPTLVNPAKVFYGKNQNCVFVLKHPTEIYLHGKVKIKCLGGTVEVLGCTLQDDTYEVYAPNNNFAQYIKTVENQNAYYGLFSKLTSTGLTVAEAEEIVTTIGEYDAIILMQPLKSRKIDFVENNFTVTDLFTKQSKGVDNCFKKVSEKLGCSLYLSRPWKSFEENSIWKLILDCGIKPKSRGIICGGKAVGKSTFLRYYVNKLLASGPVLVLDLDPGQCEFTTAGNISATVVTEPLLGPNFTHLKTPELMLHVGMINTMDNPRRYANAVETIIEQCSNDDRLKELPWIVNTMGMTNTMGLKFMSLIILQVNPTFLLQIDSRNPKKRYDFHLYSQTVKNLYFEDYQNDPLFRNVTEANLDFEFFLSHHSDNPVKNNFSLAPKEERYLNFLAYFGELLNTNCEDFLGIVPYEVSLKDISIGLNVKVNEDAVPKVINGKVVALCKPVDQDRVFTLTDTPLSCFGAALVRGVDCERGCVLVVTPAAVAEARALVYCDWAPELRGAGLARLPPATPLPYRTASQYHQRRFMLAPKRRFNPIQLLKISRSLN